MSGSGFRLLPVVRTFLLVGVLGALLGCGPGTPSYLDRVRPLGPERYHPFVRELLPLLEVPGGRSPEDLMQAWKAYLDGAHLPLQKDNVYTFVYYDFTRSRTKVSLEVSFAPGRLEPLERIGSTFLFAKCYEIPRPDQLRYRFTDGNAPLVDPFAAAVIPGGEQWHVATDPSYASVESIVGASESWLRGQDLTLLLPPAYRRDLSATYPLVIVAGLDGDSWTGPVAGLLDGATIQPLLAVSVGTRAGSAWTGPALKAELEERVLPWVRNHYRVSPIPSNVILVGWGASAKAVQEVAAGRPDLWTRTWLTGDDQTKFPGAWNILAPAWLQVQFPVVKP